MFPSSGEGKEKPTLLGPLALDQWSKLAFSKGPNRVGVFRILDDEHSPEIQ
jgi:hypothetical protein